MIDRAVVVFAMLCATPASAADLAARPTLSRADLPRLKTLDRAAAFGALGSFDDRGLSDAEFTSRALDLLDAKRIPGLAEARQASDPDGALDAVLRACRGDRASSAKAAADAAKLAAANEMLEHRFSFYGEQHLGATTSIGSRSSVR
jgi:hypothetical protein